jgi:hypothetical protein
MPTLADIRQTYPQYKDVPDDQLADKLYTKFYADKMSRDEFNTKVAAQENKTTTLGQIARGMADPIVGGAQLAEHVTPEPLARATNELNNLMAKGGLTQELPVENAMDTWVKQREAQIAQERGKDAGKIDWARWAGNALSPVNFIGAASPAIRGGIKALELGEGALARISSGAVKGGVMGAQVGATEPASKGDFWKEKLKQMGMGVVTGGAIGGLFSGAGQGLLSLGEHWLERHPESLASEAVQKILKRIKSSEATGGPSATDMIKLVNESKKPVTMADVGGPDVQGLAGNVARQPGEPRNIAEGFLKGRDKAAAERIKADIKQFVHGGESMYDTAEGLLKARSGAATPAYDEVYSLQNVWSLRLQEFLANPRVQQGLQRGYQIETDMALARGKPLNTTQLGVDLDTEGNIIMKQTPNMRLLDMAKQGLDAMIADSRNPITGRLSAQGYAMNEMRKAFVEEMDSLDKKGIYKAARQQYQGYSKSMDALKLGRSVFTNDSPEEFAAEVRGLSPGDAEFLRIGVADKLKENLSKVGVHGDESKALIKNPWMQEKLRPVFRSEKDFNDFVDAVATEEKMFETKRGVMGGSDTARRFAEDTADKSPWSGAIEKMLMGPRISGLKEAFKVWRDIGFKPDPKLNSKIAEILFSTHIEPDVATLLREGPWQRRNPMQNLTGAVEGAGTVMAPVGAADVTREHKPVTQ